MAIVHANIKSIMAQANQIGGAKIDFGDILDSSFSSDTGFEPFNTVSASFGKNKVIAPGSSSNTGIPLQEVMNNLNSNKFNPEAKSSIKNAYESLLNGDTAKNLAPFIAGLDKNNVLDKIKNLNRIGGQNTSIITDEEFFDAESLTPSQITDILKKKGSPYAYRTYEGGKSIGQLIYDACHDAGTVEEGSHTLNPAMVMAIMGAESGFGTNPKVEGNPFNIRLNGKFENVRNFEKSLEIAVNTMYNWAKNRPEDAKVSLLDYAGDKYCEDYQTEWKPNVEKYFLEFTVNKEINNNLGKIPLPPNVENMVGNLAPSLMSNLGAISNAAGNGGLNIASLMKMVTGSQNKADNQGFSEDMNMDMNLLNSANTLSLIDDLDING